MHHGKKGFLEVGGGYPVLAGRSAPGPAPTAGAGWERGHELLRGRKVLVGAWPGAQRGKVHEATRPGQTLT